MCWNVAVCEIKVVMRFPHGEMVGGPAAKQ